MASLTTTTSAPILTSTKLLTVSTATAILKKELGYYVPKKNISCKDLQNEFFDDYDLYFLLKCVGWRRRCYRNKWVFNHASWNQAENADAYNMVNITKTNLNLKKDLLPRNNMHGIITPFNDINCVVPNKRDLIEKQRKLSNFISDNEFCFSGFEYKVLKKVGNLGDENRLGDFVNSDYVTLMHQIMVRDVAEPATYCIHPSVAECFYRKPSYYRRSGKDNIDKLQKKRNLV